MAVSKLVNLLFFLHFIPVVNSENDVVTIAESNTMIVGAKCTSRKLLPSLIKDSNITVPDSTNNTVNDDGMINGDESDDIPQLLDPFCPEGYFCDLSRAKNNSIDDEVFGLCKPCPGSSDKCISSPTMSESMEDQEFLAYSLEKAVAEECQEQCGAGKNTCSSAIGCPQGLFCNFKDAEVGGYCEVCPNHFYFCGEEGRNLTSEGVESCESSCAVLCRPEGKLAIATQGSAETTYTEYNDVNGAIGSPQLSVTGPIADCKLGLEPCEDVEGSICFIERGKASFAVKTANCYAGGGIATVFYNLENRCENIEASMFGVDTYIPSVSLTHLEGKAILKRAKEMPPEMPLLATVEVGGPDALQVGCYLSCTKDIECKGTNMTCDLDNGEFGDCVATEYRAPCNDEASESTPHLKCSDTGNDIGNDKEHFCDFSKGKRGECLPCPELDNQCFFSDLNKEGAMECNAVCAGDSLEGLQSAPCKFCTRGNFSLGDIGDSFISTEDREVTTPCEFCESTSTCSSVHRWDMKFPYRTIEMFGSPVECWAVAEFYRSVNIEANTVYCESARSFNYICGCGDSLGYAGADSDAKMIALAWIPRVGAILSMLGSFLMIVEVLRDGEKRKKVIGELIIFLSVFDIIGSLGYAFTSYPTPEEDYIYGAHGNTVSCNFQGFFIQVGTISLYLNVSIAFYYLLVIQCSWREQRLRQSWLYYMLFAVPMLIGSIVAFAGIPHYDNTILWCNFSRNYYSEIPVAVAIAVATIIMVNLCWFVYKSEKASRRFRQHSEGRNSLSLAFFKQSMVYLGAFYLTWPPYLALQIMIASGRAYSQYYFFLFAGIAVTLQGFWNYVFHTAHTRIIKKSIASAVATVRSAGSRAFTSNIRSARGRAFNGLGQNNGEKCSKESGSDDDQAS